MAPLGRQLIQHTYAGKGGSGGDLRVACAIRKLLAGRELCEKQGGARVAGGLETLPGGAAAFPDDCPVYIIFFWEQNSKPPKPPLKRLPSEG